MMKLRFLFATKLMILFKNAKLFHFNDVGNWIFCLMDKLSSGILSCIELQ